MLTIPYQMLSDCTDIDQKKIPGRGLHSVNGLMTPEAIHYGWAEDIYTARQDTLLSAYELHPERFVRKTPEPPKLPTEAWINPPTRAETENYQ